MSVRQSVSRSITLCGGCRTQPLPWLSLPAVRQCQLQSRSESWRSNPRLVRSKAFSTQSARRSEQQPTDATAVGVEEQQTLDEVVLDEAVLDDDRVATDDINDIDDQSLALHDELDNDDRSSASLHQPAVPWYLQVDPPIAPQTQHGISERQRLPPLPSHSPDLLQPILEHVSVDLGIDDLSLLDLRALDPPPALGANLLMIIGTARSEKHLHVSADRLCRWLRTTHAMSPFADGLLGRNELKLKLRRKAKRSRLLSAVGAKETGAGEMDDGIRTGWVCVNVGKVDGGLLPLQQQEAAQPIKDFVGFGTQTSGCRIVVQLMTDEKRGQIDLETLWSGILRRSKKQKLVDQGQEPQDAATESGNEIYDGRVENANSRHHRRTDHAIATSRTPADSPSSSTLPEGTVVYRPAALASTKPTATYKLRSRVQAREFHSLAIRSSPILSQLYDKGALPTAPAATENPISDNPPNHRSYRVILTLRNLLEELKAMDLDAAIKALGQGHSDTATTPFLRAFFAPMPAFPDTIHWHMHLELRCFAVQLNHPRYHSRCLIETLESMRTACVLPTEDMYMMAFETLLNPLVDVKTTVGKPVHHKRTMSTALNVLEMMHEDGYDPVSAPIIKLIHQTRALPPTPLNTMPHSDDPLAETNPSSNLVDLLPSLSAAALSVIAASSSWSIARSLWELHPQHFMSRPTLVYTTMFKSAARTNDQSIAMNVLRVCVPEMIREEPIVKIEGEVAYAMKDCLGVAEPNAQTMGERGSRGEWAILWRRIMRSIGTK